MKTKISVVILTYNSAGSIEKCLKSLENQTNKNFEVLIVDDDSTDNTLGLIKRNLENYYFKIKFFRNGAHNISRGRNIGIKNAETRYVAFLDSDAYADENWVENILLNFNRDKELVLVGGREIPIYTNNFSKGNSLNDLTINKLASNFWAIKGCNFAIDKDKLDGNIFNEKFIHNEEAEFIERLNKKGKKYKFDKEIKVHHETRSTPAKFIKQIYKYGIWRVFFSFYSNKSRLVDFYPSVLIILSIILMFNNFLIGLLLIPIFSLVQSIFVIIYNKSSLNFLPYSFLGWLIKNIGWGVGIFVGLIKYPFIKENLK
ncbi:MAG: glycosyltransferase [Candidatus Nanoarchaeia archaeon]|nr:glycosyltransferase [Candidatus Nanoarchaeia archaeon]MDD5740538.1 glycosyltransferase [Candidatus Nanoarchaeia archaeon]